jgi:hypothetical protein
MLAKEDDWCLVRWHDGEVMVKREYQWEPQAKDYQYKWEYVAKDMTEKQAKEYGKLFKE